MSDVVPVGCDNAVVAVLIDGRYLRWRCTHHRCLAEADARRRRVRLYHVQDMQTGRRWTEEEPASQQKRAA